MNKKKIPDQEDINFWSEITKEIKPIKKNNKINIIPEKLIWKKIQTSIQIFDEIPKKRIITDDQIKITQIKYKQYKKFSSKGVKKIDLHGYTLQEAYDQLCYIIKNNYQQQNRSLLIITGKGDLPKKHKHESIKNNLPKWLLYTELRNYISYYSKALKQDGGDGAFYIRIRKKINN